MAPSNSDSERLEDGIRQLRELGYLQTPVERYVARRVPSQAPLWKVAPAVGLWVGIPGGVVFAWILTASAWLTRPGPEMQVTEVAWLALDMSLALGLLGFLSTTAAAALSLRWLRGPGHVHRKMMTRCAMYAPSLGAGLYLADRLGIHLLTGLPGRSWFGAAILVVLLTGTLASLMTWLQSAMFATARLQWRGVWDPPRVGWQERSIPFLVVALASATLIAFGPYRSGNHLPRLDQVEVEPHPFSQRIAILAVDGARPELLPASWGHPRPLLLDAQEKAASPVAFWNEIATGFPPSDHGLQEAAEVGARGVSAALSTENEDPLLRTVLQRILPGVGLARLRASDRRELQRPQLWEIVAHAGGVAASLNWWATYPAARHPGLAVLSDRAFLRAKEDSLDLYLAAPPGLLAELEVSCARLGLRPPTADPAAALPTVTTTGDARNWAFFLAACQDSTRDLVIALLGGGDVAARSAGPAATDYADSLRALLARDPSLVPQHLIVLVSTSLAEGPRRFWIVERGGQLLRGVHRPREVVPALLRGLGLPVAADMAGAPASGESTLATWGLRPDWSPPAGRPASDLEKLRSLGYIGD